MRTDAIMINLPEGDNKMHKQMDRSKQSTDSLLPGFAMHTSEKRKTRFAEVYSKVAQSNHNAKQITDNTVPPFKETNGSKEIQSPTESVKETDCPAIENQETIMAEIQQEENTTLSDEVAAQVLSQIYPTDDSAVKQQQIKLDEERASQAAEVVIGAVKKIAETLNINIAPEMDSLSLQTVSQENIRQFAEIVSVLKGITEVLEDTVRQGLPLDTGRALLDVEEASQTADILRTELFKIELALNMLGIGEQVQSESAGPMDVSMFSGIPQARDPADLSMPLEQIQRIFGGLIEGSSLKKQTADTPSLTVIQTANEPVKEMSVGSFDTGTYRTILKLEKKEKVGNENIQSAENLQKLKIPNTTDPAVAVNVSDSQTVIEESIPVLQVTETNQGTNQTISIENRLSSALQRTTEDNVMNQLTGKMQHLVRSGETEIRIQLRPESLGEVKLAIRMEGDVVAARIQVENQQVKQIVESNLQLLKDALAEQNLQAGSFEVNVGDGWGRQHDQPFSSNVDKSKTDDSDSINGSVEDDSLQRVNVGIETGHRYGNNSIEYYA